MSIVEISTPIEFVEMRLISDLGWPTDWEKVESFVADIRSGKDPSPIDVNRVVKEDGAVVYEIIDGLHRHAASRYEHADRMLCRIFSLASSEAMDRRIKASLDKPSQVLCKRAERALRETFILGICTRLGVSGPYRYRMLTEDGDIKYLERAVLPEDPQEALEVIREHMATFSRDTVTRIRSSGWIVNRGILHWIDDVAARFHRTTSWLKELVFSGRSEIIFGNGLPDLMDMPDAGIRSELRSHIRFDAHEKPMRADVIAAKYLSWHILLDEMGDRRTRSQILRILQGCTDLPALHKQIEGEHERRAQIAIEEKRLKEQADITSVNEQIVRGLTLPDRDMSDVQGIIEKTVYERSVMLGSDYRDFVVAAIGVSGDEISPKSRKATYKRHIPKPYVPLHNAILEFIRQMRLLEKNGGHWRDNKEVIKDLLALETALEAMHITMNGVSLNEKFRWAKFQS